MDGVEAQTLYGSDLTSEECPWTDVGAGERGLTGRVTPLFIELTHRRAYAVPSHVYQTVGAHSTESKNLRDGAVAALWAAFDDEQSPPEPDTPAAVLTFQHAMVYQADASRLSEHAFMGLLNYALPTPSSEAENWVPEWYKDHFLDLSRPERFVNQAWNLLKTLAREKN
ncbi:protein ORF86 [Cyprinid herpesvirus 1]|uniref:Protein ORF86 n=1 Tax=Cyprinid herpesvirus 1 TaxID=317858 RepID=K7PBX4_9VIRU|nr:protein ORF86 [Cyprinid herpesvirus 1]AFJ20383.1 protein ORF86 [Cyprinid herpesvirus 1]